MKAWVVSHAYVAPVNHDKLLALARLPDVELSLLLPDAWRTATGLLSWPARPVPYGVVRSRVLGNGRIGAYLYRDGFRALRRARPDVVHAELEPWSLAALQCALLAREARLVLFTWENLEGPTRRSARLVERAVLRRAAFVIAGNEAARRRVVRRGVPSSRTAVLPQFGVDADRYAGGDRGRAAATRGLAPPVVGYVGRLVPEKGVDLLVEALAPLDVRLLVVGDGPARADLERRLAGWPSGRALMAGAVPDESVPDYLAALDALVLPSRTTPTWAEQFGHVLIEAMAAGVPVVGSSSGAIPEVIADAGLVVPEGDVGALRAAIAGLVADPGRREALRDRGRARVARCYTNAAIAAAQRDIWARLLSRDL